MMSHVPSDQLLPGAPIRMLVPSTTFGNAAPVLSNYKFILASPPVSSAAHDPTAAHDRHLCRYERTIAAASPVGETWIVSGISACELFNGSECEHPTCNRNCQFLRRRRLYRFDLSRGISLLGQVLGCERFNMSQQIPSRALNV